MLQRRIGSMGLRFCARSVDPFDPESPIKKLEIQHFPPDLFFVLRTVQLLRGLAQGMGVQNFSAATQWCLSFF